MEKVNLGTVLTIIGMVIGGVVYALDWQRSQDAKLSEIDRLIERQATLLMMMQDYNSESSKMKFRGKVDTAPRPQIPAGYKLVPEAPVAK